MSVKPTMTIVTHRACGALPSRPKLVKLRTKWLKLTFDCDYLFVRTTKRYSRPFFSAALILMTVPMTAFIYRCQSHMV